MRKTSDVKFTLVFGLLAIAALTFALFPGRAIGQDSDKDGLPDSAEQSNWYHSKRYRWGNRLPILWK